MSEEKLVFDSLEPASVEVSIAGKDYVLREATEGAAITFKNAVMAAAQMKDGQVVGTQGGGGMNALLVSLCLFDAETKKPVSRATVETWPTSIITKLADKAAQISRLRAADQGEGGEAKN